MATSLNCRTLAHWSLIFCACFLATSPARKIIQKTKPMFDLISVNNCSGNGSSSINFIRDAKVTKLRRDLIVINLDIVIGRNYTKPQAVILVIKCTDRGATQCEYFMNIPLSTCYFFDAKNQYWSPIFDSIHPPLNCTHIKAGVYKMINGTIDTKKLMDWMNSMPNLD